MLGGLATMWVLIRANIVLTGSPITSKPHNFGFFYDVQMAVTPYNVPLKIHPIKLSVDQHSLIRNFLVLTFYWVPDKFHPRKIPLADYLPTKFLYGRKLLLSRTRKLLLDHFPQ